MRNEEAAKRIQLLIEYAPKPPFDAGEPEAAGPDLANAILRARKPLIDQARAIADQFAKAGPPK